MKIKAKAKALAVIITVSLSSGCTDSQDVRAFFEGNKVGNGTDWGVYKNYTDHLISVHGFLDDLDICIKIADMLNEDQPNTYSCKSLNRNEN